MVNEVSNGPRAPKDLPQPPPVIFSSIPEFLKGNRCGHVGCGGTYLSVTSVYTDEGQKALFFCQKCSRLNK